MRGSRGLPEGVNAAPRRAQPSPLARLRARRLAALLRERPGRSGSVPSAVEPGAGKLRRPPGLGTAEAGGERVSSPPGSPLSGTAGPGRVPLSPQPHPQFPRWRLFGAFNSLLPTSLRASSWRGQPTRGRGGLGLGRAGTAVSRASCVAALGGKGAAGSAFCQENGGSAARRPAAGIGGKAGSGSAAFPRGAKPRVCA